MAEITRYLLKKPARLLYASIAEKSAPRNVAGAVPKFSGTFGIEKEDFDAIVPIMVAAIKSETGNFTGPGDYFLACMGGATAAKRVLEKAELDCFNRSEDEKFKLREKATKRAELYRQFAGILVASSQFDVQLAQLAGGKIVDIGDTPHARATAGKEMFYPGAYVVPSLAFKGFRRKTVDAKDGCTAYLQNCMFVRHAPKLGGSGPSNNEVFGSYQGYSDVDPLAAAPFSNAMNDEISF